MEFRQPLVTQKQSSGGLDVQELSTYRTFSNVKFRRTLLHVRTGSACSSVSDKWNCLMAAVLLIVRALILNACKPQGICNSVKPSKIQPYYFNLFTKFEVSARFAC